MSNALSTEAVLIVIGLVLAASVAWLLYIISRRKRMSNKEPVNHLNPNFYTTPKFARQVMTYHEWQETAKATEGRIIANGETYELKARHMGGGMHEITAHLTYWKNGKPQKKA